jgi:hypothetical protein
LFDQAWGTMNATTRSDRRTAAHWISNGAMLNTYPLVNAPADPGRCVPPRARGGARQLDVIVAAFRDPQLIGRASQRGRRRSLAKPRLNNVSRAAGRVFADRRKHDTSTTAYRTTNGGPELVSLGLFVPTTSR